jgi:hypothetical protein
MPPASPPEDKLCGDPGAPARVLGMIEAADEARRRGDSIRDKISIPATDPGDGLALALTPLGGAMVATGRAV